MKNFILLAGGSIISLCVNAQVSNQFIITDHAPWYVSATCFVVGLLAILLLISLVLCIVTIRKKASQVWIAFNVVIIFFVALSIWHEKKQLQDEFNAPAYSKSCMYFPRSR